MTVGGIFEEPTGRRQAVTFDNYIIAFYAGSCALDEDHDIVPGTRIGHTARGWACNRCVRDARPMTQ